MHVKIIKYGKMEDQKLQFNLKWNCDFKKYGNHWTGLFTYCKNIGVH